MSLSEGIRCEVIATRKIDACCDPSSSRHILGAVEIIPVVGAPGVVWACASDGKCLSVVRTAGETEAQQPYYLPAKFLKPGKKAATARLNGRWESDNRMADEPQGRFPRVQDCLPNDTESWPTLTFNAHLLSKLAEAIGADGVVTIFIPPLPEKPKEFRKAIPVVGDAGFGVLMPVSEPTKAQERYEECRKKFADDRSEAEKNKIATEQAKMAKAAA